MSDNAIGQLRKVAGRYEFTYPPFDLVIRGPHPEWVLEAAAEIIARTEKLRAEGSVEELTILTELGEANGGVELDALKYQAKSRFDTIPQCVVSMGDNDYRWVQRDGRDAPQHVYVERLFDMSKTRNNDWLSNEP